jgi:3-oxoacyl-[acyl-carrier-protein] synthase III
MSNGRDVYIAGIGSHSPGEPVPFERIEQVLGPLDGLPPKIEKWVERMRPIMKEMLGVKACHYAIDPESREPTEDNVSLSIKAARRALAVAGLEPTDLDLIVYGGNIMEYACPPTTTLIQEELKIPSCAEYAIHSNCTSIYKALQLATDQIRLGRYNHALLVTSTLASPFLRAEHYNVKVVEKSQILLRWFLCDGGGALVLTSDPSIGRNRLRVVDTYVDSRGLGLGPDMYCRVGGHRVQPHAVWENGWHHLTQNFDQVAALGAKLCVEATERLMERIGMEWQQIKYAFLNIPTRHLHDLGVEEARKSHRNPNIEFYSKLADRGYPGACAIIHSLDGFLSEVTPQPGDLLGSVVVESSKWMFAGFVLEYLGKTARPASAA